MTKRTTLAAEADDLAVLEGEARRRGVSLARVLRELVEREADEIRRVQRPRFGIARSGGRNLSQLATEDEDAPIPGARRALVGADPRHRPAPRTPGRRRPGPRPLRGDDRTSRRGSRGPEHGASGTRLLGREVPRSSGVDCVRRGRRSWCIPLLSTDEQDLHRAAELAAQYEDIELGYVDASVIAFCERFGERKVATLDRRDFSVRPRHCDRLRLVPE